MCHINMLKPYHARDQIETSVKTVTLVAPYVFQGKDEEEVEGNIPTLGES